VVIITVHLIEPVDHIPPNVDRITRFSGRHRLAQDVAKTVAHDPVPLFSPYYQRVAELRYLGVDARQEPGMTRPSHFTQKPDSMVSYNRFYFLCEFDLPTGHVDIERDYEPPQKVRTFRLDVRGEKFDDYVLWLYQRRIIR